MTTAIEPNTDFASISAYGPARSTVKGTPLSADELRKTNAYWQTCNYLSLGMIYLKSESSPEGTAQTGAHQEPSARSLGIESRTFVHLCAPKSPDQETRSRCNFHGWSRPRCAGRSRSRLSGRNVFRGLSVKERRRLRSA